MKTITRAHYQKRYSGLTDFAWPRIEAKATMADSLLPKRSDRKGEGSR
jgi:hypothetical protein